MQETSFQIYVEWGNWRIFLWRGKCIILCFWM